jgi:hypothetical protein
VDSLLPPADPAAAPPAAPAAPAPPAAKPAEPEADWFLMDGVRGTGKAPEWFKADKYKSIDKQAEAYVELEKRFGAFKGAPKDGKYEFKMPENVTGELDVEHPIYKGFETWAREHQLSNDGFNQLLGMFVEYEAAMAPNITEIKVQLGDKADERIANTAKWAQANMTPSQYALFREATSGVNAAAVFQTVEAMLAHVRQPALPGPGAETTTGGGPTPWAIVQAERAKRGPDGKLLIHTSEQHRAKVDKMTNDYFAAHPDAPVGERL